jgi:hypothetical protein
MQSIDEEARLNGRELEKENLEGNLRQTEISRTTGERRLPGWLEMYICELYLSTFESGNLSVENGEWVSSKRVTERKQRPWR